MHCSYHSGPGPQYSAHACVAELHSAQHPGPGPQYSAHACVVELHSLQQGALAQRSGSGSPDVGSEFDTASSIYALGEELGTEEVYWELGGCSIAEHFVDNIVFFRIGEELPIEAFVELDYVVHAP